MDFVAVVAFVQALAVSFGGVAIDVFQSDPGTFALDTTQVMSQARIIFAAFAGVLVVAIGIALGLRLLRAAKRMF